MGIILYEILVGVPPFEAKTPFELMKELETYTVMFPQDKYPVSKECLDLIYGLLKKDVNQRIGWEEFFLHPWLGLHNQDSVAVPSPPATIPSPAATSAPTAIPQSKAVPIAASPNGVSASPSPTAPIYGYTPTHTGNFAQYMSPSPSPNAPIQTFNPFPIAASPSTNNAPIYNFTPGINFHNNPAAPPYGNPNYLISPSPPNPQNMFPFAGASPPRDPNHVISPPSGMLPTVWFVALT